MIPAPRPNTATIRVLSSTAQIPVSVMLTTGLSRRGVAKAGTNFPIEHYSEEFAALVAKPFEDCCADLRAQAAGLAAGRPPHRPEPNAGP